MANWSVLKNPDCSNALRSKLHRNFGKLYASQGRFEKALKELANDVFYSSLEMGPEHIDTAGGYYHMATIFFSQVRNVFAASRPLPLELTSVSSRTKLITLWDSTTRLSTFGTSSWYVRRALIRCCWAGVLRDGCCCPFLRRLECDKEQRILRVLAKQRHKRLVMCCAVSQMLSTVLKSDPSTRPWPF